MAEVNEGLMTYVGNMSHLVAVRHQLPHHLIMYMAVNNVSIHIVLKKKSFYLVRMTLTLTSPVLDTLVVKEKTKRNMRVSV